MTQRLQRNLQRLRELGFAAPDRQSVTVELRLVHRELASLVVAGAQRRGEQARRLIPWQCTFGWPAQDGMLADGRFCGQARIGQMQAPLLRLERRGRGDHRLRRCGSRDRRRRRTLFLSLLLQSRAYVASLAAGRRRVNAVDRTHYARCFRRRCRRGRARKRGLGRTRCRLGCLAGRRRS
jgi:hypothetical protein